MLAGMERPTKGFDSARAAMDMNDDVLGLVLERVGSYASLIRAAAVCRRWRRAIADDAFLRRYRSLHAPAAVAGYYHNGYLPDWRKGGAGAPLFVPSSPRVVDPRRFSLDFIPGGAWDVKDSRGSLLLLMASPFATASVPFGSRDHLVCEPLTRRYKRIPFPPPGLDHSCRFLESYLLDGEANEEHGLKISMSNFRVLCTFSHGVGVATHAVVFAVNSPWSEKSIDHIAPNSVLSRLLGRGGGSWYFYGGDNVLIKLDGSTGEFSSSVLPAIEDWDVLISRYKCFVTDSRDGKPRIFAVVDGTMKVYARLDGADWALYKSVLLSEATRRLRAYQPSAFSLDPIVRTRGCGFVVLYPQFLMTWPFSIDLETMDTGACGM
ncbi:unnamed protein product [Urochloa decumbens]|uniref:F-box domain-containing protein n=1 Tax=Urochloa decumbens TaxID=240449 RepID=A0ABC8WAX7_9POAL